MRKKYILASLLLVSGLFASCLRSDDLDILKHPIHVTGSVSPNYGIPVAYGEMNINDLISHLSSDYQGAIVEDEDVITIEYEASTSDTIKAFNSIPTPGYSINHRQIVATKDDAVFFHRDTVFSDTIDIDLFNDIEHRGEIDIEHIWIKLGVSAFGQCPSSVRPYVTATFDSLQIKYEDHDGVMYNFDGIDIGTVHIPNISDGFERSFDTVDVAEIVNRMPRRLYVSYRFQFNITANLFDTTNIFYIGQMLDSLSMTQLVYSANLRVLFPMSVQFNQLYYSFDLDLGDGLSSVNLDSIAESISEGVDVDIKDARFRMVLDNGIPLALNLSAILQDREGGRDLLTIFNNKTIASSTVVNDDPSKPTQYHTASSVATEIEASLNNDDIETLRQAKNLRVVLKVDSNNKHVAIRRSDFLKIKAYIQLHPEIDFDIAVTDNGIL